MVSIMESDVVYVPHGFNRVVQTWLVLLTGYLDVGDKLCDQTLPFLRMDLIITLANCRCCSQYWSVFDQSLVFFAV